MRNRIRDIALGAAAAALMLAPLPVLAADAAGEIVTAATHADLASKASDLAGTQMHLHHALNCLVGPGGNGFDPKNMNPCANSGAGAIPDTTDAKKKAELEAAANLARTGLAAPDQATAQKDAAQVANALKAIK
ncbi:MAG TPA: hypothetical protein VMU08_13965 [Rhizomicrobium sp.]|nr:hypothetical protein [Rhizomicrobium sp.]